MRMFSPNKRFLAKPVVEILYGLNPSFSLSDLVGTTPRWQWNTLKKHMTEHGQDVRYVPIAYIYPMLTDLFGECGYGWGVDDIRLAALPGSDMLASAGTVWLKVGSEKRQVSVIAANKSDRSKGDQDKSASSNLSRTDGDILKAGLRKFGFFSDIYDVPVDQQGNTNLENAAKSRTDYCIEQLQIGNETPTDKESLMVLLGNICWLRRLDPQQARLSTGYLIKLYKEKNLNIDNLFFDIWAESQKNLSSEGES